MGPLRAFQFCCEPKAASKIKSIKKSVAYIGIILLIHSSRLEYVSDEKTSFIMAFKEKEVRC